MGGWFNDAGGCFDETNRCYWMRATFSNVQLLGILHSHGRVMNTSFLNARSKIAAMQMRTTTSTNDVLIEYLQDHGIDAIATVEQLREQEVATAEFETETSFTKLWFITRGLYVVFITYNCDPLMKDVEISEVREIVRIRTSRYLITIVRT